MTSRNNKIRQAARTGKCPAKPYTFFN